MATKNKSGTKPATQDGHEGDDEAPERDPFLNAWRCPYSADARTLVADAVAPVEAHEEQNGLRKRRRKPGDQRTFEATVGAIISDLVYRALLTEPRWVAVTRSNQKLGAKSRYRPRAFAGTTIEDRPVAYLDYGQTTARIAYGSVGAVPRLRDLYKVPGLELWRDGVKKLLSAMLFADRPLTRKPQHTARLLPNRTIGELRDAIQQAHAPIADLFEQGVGHRLQFCESEVLVGLLLRLRDLNIVALPVHDAVIVRKDRRSKTAAVMKDVFKEKIGVAASVGVEVA